MSIRSSLNVRYSEMMEDLEASFISVTNNPNSSLKSKAELFRALQISGRNPSQKSIDKHWKSYEKIGINEFFEIGKAEPEVSEKELVDAFKEMDVDKNGYISYREMLNALTQSGENMGKREVQDLIESADINRDDKIDYKEFTKMIFDTIREAKNEAKKQTRKIMRKFENNPRIFSREDLRRTQRSPAKNRRMGSTDSDASPRRDERKRKMGSRLSFADEKEFDDDFGPHRREGAKKNSMRKNELSRSTESLRSLMKSMSNLDMRSPDRRRDKKEEKINNTKFDSHHKLFEVKLEAANKASKPEPKNLKKWSTRTTKGGVYRNDQPKATLSNSFVLDLKTPSAVHLAIQISPTQIHSNPNLVNMDMCLLVVKNGKNLKLKTITENKSNNSWTATLDLEPGAYFLFPFTTGCHLKRLDTTKSFEKLFKDEGRKKTLSNKFRNALMTVFDMFDLDSNGRLSKNEFNFYSIVSSGEELSDEDWDMIQNLVELKKGELNKDGFLRLHEIEAENQDFNLDDMHQRLLNLGFNKALEIDQSCPFVLNVSCETDDFELLLGEIFELNSCHKFLGQLIQEKGTKKQLKAVNNLEFWEYHNQMWSLIQVDNMSNRETFEMKIKSSKSENCVSNSNSMEEVVSIKPEKSKIAMFVAPNNPNKDWVVRYDVSI